jgi:hypothetical protein
MELTYLAVSDSLIEELQVLSDNVFELENHYRNYYAMTEYPDKATASLAMIGGQIKMLNQWIKSRNILKRTYHNETV